MRLFLVLILILINGNKIVYAENLIPVAFGGVFTAGKPELYPIYSKNTAKINSRLTAVLSRLNEKQLLPFNLLTETDSEAIKKETADPLTLALIITRDDVASESYITPVATINKTFVNVGMVAIIYQTGNDADGKERNIILNSIPLVGYSMTLEGDRKLSPEELDELFAKNAELLLEDHLSKRLSKISLNRINGVIKAEKDDGYIIDKGAVDGLVDEQNISIDVGGKKIRAKVVKLEKNESQVKAVETVSAKVGMPFSAKNIKGLASDTFQVVSFKASSKKALTIFEETALGSQVSQWFSDFMVDKAGLAFFPSKVGGQWIESATKNSFMLLIKDGQEYSFEVPPPKYPISLELTGLGSKVGEHNDVNEIWIYGAFMKVDIPNKNYSSEFKNSAAKSVVTGMQSFESKDVMFDLMHSLTAKIASEIKLDN